MDFPKNREGWSGQGRTDARFLRDGLDDSTWLRKKRVGSEARNRGGRLEVRKLKTGDTGLFWAIDSNGDLYGSRTARNFEQVGTTVFTGFLVEGAPVTGGGYLLGVAAPSNSTFATDFLGHPTSVYDLNSQYVTDLRTTPTLARTMVFGVSENMITGYRLQGNIWPENGSWYTGGWRALTVFDASDGGQHVIKYELNDFSSTSFGTAFGEANLIAKSVTAGRVGPNSFMHVTCGVIAASAVGHPEYVPANTRTLDFHVTNDFGATWTLLTKPSFLQDELAIWKDYYNDDAHPTRRQLYINLKLHTHMYCVPLDADNAYAVMHYPIIITPGSTWDTTDMRIRVQHMSINRLTGAFADRGYVDYDIKLPTANVNRAWAMMERPPLVVPGGLLRFESSDPENYITAPVKVGFTADGSTPPVWTNTPWVSACMGIPIMLDSRTVICSVYDGQYSVYQTRDHGVTWTRRGTISEDTTPPSVASGQYFSSAMQRFGKLVYQARNGKPVSPTPGTPWVSDERVAYA